MKKLLFVASIILFYNFINFQPEHKKTLLFVGSFTNKKPGKGIHVYEFNESNGNTSLKFVLDSVINTSFLKVSPNGKTLFSVMESQMETHGKIASFTIDSLSGKLKLNNIQDCGGRNPVHIEINSTNNVLINSNYTDPSLSVFKILNNGKLNPYHQIIRFKDSSIIKDRQESSHIHSSNFYLNNHILLAQDLGADKIRTFNLTKNNDEIYLENENSIQMKAGSGPRHFTCHPNGKYGYSISELSGKITVFKYNKGHFVFTKDYLSYQKKQDLYRAADIHISPDGKFLYTTNRGPNEDSIAIFLINQVNGELTLIGHEPTFGEHPRNFVISPNGKFLLVANQFSNKITIFKRNLKTGKLTKLNQELEINAPSSLQMKNYKVRT